MNKRHKWTQSHIDILYKDCDAVYEEDADDRFAMLVRQNGGEFVMVRDLKAEHDCEPFIDFLRKEGYIVLNDPIQDGSDDYGWIVFAPKKKLKTNEHRKAHAANGPRQIQKRRVRT